MSLIVPIYESAACESCENTTNSYWDEHERDMDLVKAVEGTEGGRRSGTVIKLGEHEQNFA